MTLRVSQSEAITAALDHRLPRLVQNIDRFAGQFPNSGRGQQYQLADNRNWLAAFWPGVLWQSYQFTADERFRQAAEALLPTFVTRLDQQIHITHDLGFLYSLSARAQWQVQQDNAAQELALRAADELLARYRAPGRYIQAWGAVGDAQQGGRIIADTMMNLPLLFWASEVTGDPRYHEAARAHAHTSRTYLVRPDGSSYHTYFFDQHSGTPLYGRTHQGYGDESLWARGHAWLIYGFALAAQWCPADADEFVTTARQLGETFMANLPADQVPLWDLWLPDTEAPYRDSSAGAIAACGFLRLAQLGGEGQAHQNALQLVDALLNHCLETDPAGEGLLKHGALHIPKGWAPDEYLIFGDYFFLEALLILNETAADFWGPGQ